MWCFILCENNKPTNETLKKQLCKINTVVVSAEGTVSDSKEALVIYRKNKNITNFVIFFSIMIKINEVLLTISGSGI